MHKVRDILRDCQCECEMSLLYFIDLSDEEMR